MTTTKIQWAERVWNPVTGCTRVSPGCDNCYAIAMSKRLQSMKGPAGAKYAGTVDIVSSRLLGYDAAHGDVRGAQTLDWTGKVMCHEDELEKPLRWRKPSRIFVNSMSDLFHEDVHPEFIARVFAVMALCPQHQFLILTKRPVIMKTWFKWIARQWKQLFESTDQIDANVVLQFLGSSGPIVDHLSQVEDQMAPLWPLSNVWLGVSCENQAMADQRIPHLLATPAAVRFVSCEPLLGEIDLNLQDEDGSYDTLRGNVGVESRGHVGGQPKIDWVIVGGESGPNARPMHPDWARSLRDQCIEDGVPFFFKQWGEWCPGHLRSPGWYWWQNNCFGNCCGEKWNPEVREGENGVVWERTGKKVAGSKLYGVEYREMPE